MLMLTPVVAAVMLHVVASKPMDVDVEVTINGVKIPINEEKGEEPPNPDLYKEDIEPSKSGKYYK